MGQIAGKCTLAGKNYFLGVDLRVTAYLVQSSTLEIGKLFFLLRVPEPKRKKKSIEGQRSIKHLNLVYFQRDVYNFSCLLNKVQGA